MEGKLYDDIGLLVPSTLLPRKGIDMQKWAVVACDQFTSQREYWQKVARFIGGSPSTLNLILPEAYLSEKDIGRRINGINHCMNKYLQDEMIVAEKPGLILVERTVRGKKRVGVIAALDLEKYDYGSGTSSLTRPTEGIITERLPSRIKIREDATIELPHIMVLIDDLKSTVIETMSNKKLKKIYDFELMIGAGHITGWKIEDEKAIDDFAKKISKLKRGKNAGKPMLFAVGDGNHSLAAAKAVWERIKSGKGIPKLHPARFALVEIVNIHSDAIGFEPIHRVVFDIVEDELIVRAKKHFNEAEVMEFETLPGMHDALRSLKKGHIKWHLLPYLSRDDFGIIVVRKPLHKTEAATLQGFIESLGARIDYIHGEQALKEIIAKEASIGFLLPPFPKAELFSTIMDEGLLPRKTFSMGNAEDKRFYLEARKIR